MNKVISREKKWEIINGDSLNILKSIPNSSIQSSISSPPYFNLRDYNNLNEIGSEKNPKDYIENIIEIYKEVKRVLRRDGTCWINIGDKYTVNTSYKDLDLKGKDLIGLPWELARTLRKDRWHLRQMIPWVKQNALPENVNDRPNNSIEYIIFLSKNKNYYYDMEGAKECLGIKRNWRNGDCLLFMDVPTQKSYHNHPSTMPKELVKIMIKTSTSEKGCCSICKTPLKRIIEKKRIPPPNVLSKSKYYQGKSKNSITSLSSYDPKDRRKTTIIDTIGWNFSCNCNTKKTIKQIIIDPFSGSGTTGTISLELNRSYIGIELSKEYTDKSIKRLKEKEKTLLEEISF